VIWYYDSSRGVTIQTGYGNGDTPPIQRTTMRMRIGNLWGWDKRMKRGEKGEEEGSVAVMAC